jgi:regulator of sigma E protease
VSWVLTILGIVVLIVLHELGHFTVAKLVGMRVERFSLFFPPTIARIRRGETEYAIGAIPAGGYVKITGMNPEELGDMDPELSRRAYYSQPPWKRVAVILAGPAVNLAIAFVLFWVVLGSGSINGSIALSNLDPSVQTLKPSTAVLAVDRGTPAASTLRPGDRIVAIDGTPVTLSSARKRIGMHRCPGSPTDGCRASTPAAITIARHSHRLTVAVYPRYSKVAGRMLIGIAFGEPKHFGALSAAGAAVHEMWSSTTRLLSSIGKAFTSEKVRSEFHSIVGIAEIGHETVKAGAGYAFVFLGFISLILAVFNLFPFLPLDGGHVLWAVAEKLRGKRVSLASMYRFSSVGIILLLFLVLNGLSNDINHLAG